MIKPILCPICQKPALGSLASPFCSDRCRKVDLMRWCDGRYAITETFNSDEEGFAAHHQPGLNSDGEIMVDPDEF